MKSYPKTKRFRSPKHRKRFKDMACLACRYGIHLSLPIYKTLNVRLLEIVDPSHESFGNDKGTALKSSDLFIVPLCRYHHDIREDMGTFKFWGHRLFDMLIFMYGVNRESFGVEKVNRALIHGLRKFNEIMGEKKT